jgi:ATP-binding cassette subfamily B (MDR/TAP) protein 1
LTNSNAGHFILQEVKEVEAKPSFGRVLAMNRPEWGFILCGCFASLINGAIQPAFAIIFGEFIGVCIKLSISCALLLT